MTQASEYVQSQRKKRGRALQFPEAGTSPESQTQSPKMSSRSSLPLDLCFFCDLLCDVRVLCGCDFTDERAACSETGTREQTAQSQTETIASWMAGVDSDKSTSSKAAARERENGPYLGRPRARRESLGTSEVVQRRRLMHARPGPERAPHLVGFLKLEKLLRGIGRAVEVRVVLQVHARGERKAEDSREPLHA